MEKYYLVKNGQGDVTNVMRINGDGADHPLTTVATYTYSAYGEILEILGEDGQPINTDTTTYPYEDMDSLAAMMNTIAVLNPFRYRSYYYDSANEMYYCNTRYYDPMLCRFLSPDCYVNQDQGIIGMNIYAYCNNNPVNFIDPSGTFFGEIFNWFKSAVSAVVSFVAKHVFQIRSSSETKDPEVARIGFVKVTSGEKTVASTPVKSPVKLYADVPEMTTGVEVNAGNISLSAGVNLNGYSQTTAISYGDGHGNSVSISSSTSAFNYSITYSTTAAIDGIGEVTYYTMEVDKRALALAVVVGVFAPQIALSIANIYRKIKVFA